jgi:pre-mRNA-splicing factor 38B
MERRKDRLIKIKCDYTVCDLRFAMSRSALAKETRNQYTQALATLTAESYQYTNEENEDQSEMPNVLPVYGNVANFNINSLLFNNIMENEYFRALYQLRTYHEVLYEIQTSVTHVEPWQVGTARFPSTAFCLLVKFMVMKLTARQMKGLLYHKESCLVRAIGALYLRYTCNPAHLWKWFEPLLEESVVFAPSAEKNIKMTFGDYLIKILTDMQYYGTTFPRIPVPVERRFKVMLLLLKEKKRRREDNLKIIELISPGTKIKAIYSDEVNEPAWYEAVIDSFEDETKLKVWVTFPEYGNTECVDLGDIELGSSSSDKANSNFPDSKLDVKRSRSRSRSRNRRDRSQSRSKDPSESLLAKVLEDERAVALSTGKNYGSRPVSYKESLSLRADRFTSRRRSRTPERRNDISQSHRRSPTHRQDKDMKPASRCTEENAKLAKLKEKYGDASAL